MSGVRMKGKDYLTTVVPTEGEVPIWKSENMSESGADVSAGASASHIILKFNGTGTIRRFHTTRRSASAEPTGTLLPA